MSDDYPACVKLVLEHPSTLDDVAMWAALAEKMGMPSDSSIEAGFGAIAVTSHLGILVDPRCES